MLKDALDSFSDICDVFKEVIKNLCVIDAVELAFEETQRQSALPRDCSENMKRRGVFSSFDIRDLVSTVRVPYYL